MEMMIPEAATTLAALSTPASCAGSAVGWADADPWRELPSVAVADRGRGTPKHSIVKQDAAGHDMITVGTRPTNVAPDHELSLVSGQSLHARWQIPTKVLSPSQRDIIGVSKGRVTAAVDNTAGAAARNRHLVRAEVPPPTIPGQRRRLDAHRVQSQASRAAHTRGLDRTCHQFVPHARSYQGRPGFHGPLRDGTRCR